MESGRKTKASHFVLIHGASGGAWSWYKVTDLLLKAGHTVTALDMCASGLNPKKYQDIKTFEEYSEPLLQFMANLPQNKNENEKVILVGHSMGGFNISVAMENFPNKISVAVFVTACMPPGGTTFPQFLEEVDRLFGGDWKDSVFEFEEEDEAETGKKYFERVKAYELSPAFAMERTCPKCDSQDLVLAGSLFRRSPYIKEKITLTEEKYGSVKRVYVVCKQDELILPELQMKLIEKNPPHKVYEIEDSDHCVALSNPNALAEILDEISATF